jgi:putative beta barrel porin BBP7
MTNGLLSCVVVLAGAAVAAAQPPGPPPAMPFVMPPTPGTDFVPPMQVGVPYAQPPQPVMPFVMPPPPGMHFPPPTPPVVEMDDAAGADGHGAGSDDADHRGPKHFWADTDFLIWWIKGAHTPTLLTSGSPDDASPGALGQPGTESLFGGNIAYAARLGGRVGVGLWLAEENGYHFGLQGNMFYLGRGSINFQASSPGSPVLARPFLDATTGAESASLLAFPGLQSGQFVASVSSRLWGAEVETRSEAVDTGVIRIDLLTGLRYLEYLETLETADATTVTGPSAALAGLTIQSSDRFAAGNYFYGFEIGADGTAEFGRLSVRVLGKVAFGDTHEVVSVGGSTISTTGLGGAATIAVPNGFLTLPTNSGRHGREAFTVVPEAGLTLGYAVTKHVRATVGYTFLYSSDVLRPGDQADHALNVTQIPPPLGPGALTGPARPAFGFHDTDFWAQGVNLGLEFRY